MKLQTNVLYGKITNADNSLSCFENGDRFIYASAGIIPPLPKRVVIDGHSCRIFHKNQKYKCPRCDLSDHKVTDTDLCAAHISRQDILPFRHESHVFSNFHLCKISYDIKVFSSIEHAYQYEKCHKLIKNAAAQIIILSPTGRSAKSTADKVIKDVKCLVLI